MKIFVERNIKFKNKQKFPINFLDYWFGHLLNSLPLLIALFIFLLTVNLKTPFLFLCGLVSILVTLVIGRIGRHAMLSRQSIKLLQTLVVAFIVNGFCWFYSAEPAQAQFFKKAEDFFQYNLTQGLEGGSSTIAAVSLVFNVLRAIYLLYIAVSLIGVVNSLRKDEDWQTVARIPLLVVVAVTIADVLTGFILGN